MNYGVSFILGILVAVAALIAQVTFGIFAEVLWQIPWSPTYDTTRPFEVALPLLIVGACTEELIRVVCAAKVFHAATLTRAEAVTHGALLGGGTWLCEACLRAVSNEAIASPYSLLPLSIHLCAGILAVAVMTQWRQTTFARAGVAAGGAIILHFGGNLLIFALRG